MLRMIVLSVAAAVAATGLASGQDFPPKPGPEHEKLKKLEGNWDAVMKTNGRESKATATYRAICGGLWIESDFQGELGDVKFQGRGLDGYDQRKKKYVGVWVDSLETAPLQVEGDYDDKGVLVMTGESFGPDGKPQKIKTTTEMKDDDHMTFKLFMLQPDDKEQLAFTIEYTRRK